ncbi:GDSL-type esterase/lipase family protein [Streptosporangium sp. G11]|uniref:GDSL-type esterase/lipase family protein n=1 Tax=Streptosporangium sp. G11 TaxID=3436926 RepID=UPI003EBA58C2
MREHRFAHRLITIGMTLLLLLCELAVPAQARSASLSCGLPKSLHIPAATAVRGVSIGCGAEAKAAQPTLQAAADDLVLTFGFEGVNQAAMQMALDKLYDADVPLSDQLRDVYEGQEQFYVDVESEPADVDFNGTVRATSTGLAIVIPADEVHANLSWWAKSVITLLVAGAARWGSHGLCMMFASAPPTPLALLMCSTLSGAVGGFAGYMTGAWLLGEKMDNATFWLGALAASVVGGLVSGALWDRVKEWMGVHLPGIVATIGTALIDLARTGMNWAGEQIVSGVRALGESIRGMRDRVWEAMVREAHRRGIPLVLTQVRLMPLGDSITQGVGSSTLSGYRSTLWNRLTENGRTVDFVGTQRDGSFADIDHQGHSGWRIDQIAGDAAYCSVPARRPNVVTLHAGTNDMNQAFELPDAPARLGALIDQVLGHAPEATVLVATLVPATKAGLQPRIDAFNAKLPGIVEQRQKQGKHVRLVDMRAVTPADLAQPAHPGDNGYRKMADAFHLEIGKAMLDGWITDPAPTVPGSLPGTPGSLPVQCANPDQSKAGPGWRSLGVIATGMSTPAGRTDLVELNGDNRGDYVRITADGAVRGAYNTPGEPGQPDWVDAVSIGPDPDPAAGDKVRFADMNGDGLDDYLMVGDEGSVEAWYRSNDTFKMIYGGVVAPGVSGATRKAIRFADVNGDGRDDYLRTSDAGAVHAYINTPAANGRIHWVERLNWAPGVSYGTRDKLRLADVNGDRRADYLMVDSTGRVHAYINNGGGGAGGFIPYLNYVNATGYPGEKVTFRDISGDGRADYVVIYDGGAIRAWLNIGGNGGN